MLQQRRFPLVQDLPQLVARDLAAKSMRPARQAARGSDHATFEISGVDNVTIENCQVGIEGADGNLGIYVSNSANLSVQNTRIIGCKIAMQGHGANNLSVLDVEINGRRLVDFTGDFDLLAVISADEILHLGEMLYATKVTNRLEVLRNSKLGRFLENRSFGDWVGLAGFLAGLASLTK